MSDTPKPVGANPVAVARETGSLFWKVLGILWGTATLISLIKSGFAIELHGLPARLHADYVWLRDMLFEPLVWPLKYVGLTVPWWAKDLIVAYGLIATAVGRGSRSKQLSEMSSRKVGGWTQSARLYGGSSEDGWLLDALFWPLTLTKWIRIRNVRERYLGSRVRPRSAAADERFRLRTTKRLYGLRLKFFLWSLAAILLFALAFFLWNHVQSTFGPVG